MPAKELLAYMDGILAGRVAQSPQGNTTFTYDEDYRQSADATPLSLSMPLTRAKHPSRAIMPFLAGLLPDNEARLARLASEYQTSTNPFALLTHIGRDSAGAIQLLPPGEDSSDAATRQGDIARLSTDDFADLIADIVDNAATWGSRTGMEARWSLPGAQPKIALFRFDDGSWGVPRDSTPTTHVLKPAMAPYADHDVNEHVTMAAAERLGLTVADHGILTTPVGHRVFVSRRYDRSVVDGRWIRRHQEDLCQALSVPPAMKYQGDGGPGVAAIADLFRDSVPDLHERRRAREQFFGALVFAVSAACTDAHAKNYSLLLERRSVKLAPLYDLGTHAPYRASAPLRSAMKVGDEYRFAAISKRMLVATARRLSLDEEWAENRVDEIRSGAAQAFSDAAAHIDAPYAGFVADAVAAFAEGRS
ncbi:HipA domain-containing protein [Salinibacterium sp. SYSU T00001]|uniref:HipA domain-containing protein n=1 Tax=Homoserinimonas sedimenticola TaxID=2986805 RepID=UPI0022359F5D|nr:HipA domain-containing protein [Salinibacterium sedimenticola]MCW4385467.1 HipA domain-containing protein [Salinibacterium sedimenticola]